MPSEEELSPEEKLLKVIQQGRKTGPSDPLSSAKPAPVQNVPATAPSRPSPPPPAPAVSEPAIAASAEAVRRPVAVPAQPPPAPAVSEPVIAAPAEAVRKPVQARPPVAPVVSEPVIAAPAEAVRKPVPAQQPARPAPQAKEPVKRIPEAAPAISKDAKPKESAPVLKAHTAAAPPAKAGPVADAAPAKEAADEARLGLGAKIGGSPSVPKQLGNTLPDEKPEATAAPVAPRRRSGLTHGLTMKLVNRLLAAACVLLTLGLVLELLAAKPGLPKPPENVVFSRVNGEIVRPEEPGEDVGKRDIWSFAGGGEGPTQLHVAEPSADVEKYIHQNMTLDGVSRYPSEQAMRSFAVVTDQAPKGLGTRYWKIKTGATLTVPGIDRPVEIILDEILENQIIFIYEGKRIPLSGRR